MPAYNAPFSSYYNGGGVGSSNIGGNWDNGTITDGGDDVWTVGETVTDTSGSGIFFSNGATYKGTIGVNGTPYPVVEVNLTGAWVVLFNDATDHAAAPATMPAVYTYDYAACFLKGTEIDAPEGAVKVEELEIGDRILDCAGRQITVKWIGRKTLHKMFAGPKMQPVCIRAGALGGNLPHSDLSVTADHGMIIDGLVINASALINCDSIDWVPLADLPEQFAVYHVETENHDVICANGAPTETFIDYRDRRAFDNFQDYLDLYGTERIIPEMASPRISARRQLPLAIRDRLNIGTMDDQALTA